MSELLKHQIEYYRARAPEYDDWFYRRGRYDQGEAHTRQWQAEAQQVRDQLHSASGFAHILEMAPGTGIWTQELIKIGEGLTALDASPEMININRAKLLSDARSSIFSRPTCSSGVRSSTIRYGIFRLLAFPRAKRNAGDLP